MKIVTSEEMRELEELSSKTGISTHQLMENAGLAFAEEVRERMGGVTGSHIAVLAGSGNNGGDGLVAARYLHDWGANVCVYLCTPRAKADSNLELLLARDLQPVHGYQDSGFERLNGILDTAEIVIDAVLGTGRSRSIEGVLKEILTAVQRSIQESPGKKIIALDLPSGLDANSGAADSACLGADVTVTLGYPKVGLFTFPGASLVGEMVVADIGIPEDLGRNICLDLMTPSWIGDQMPTRLPDSHKGTFGRVLAVAGSISYIGAAYLACEGAARVGAGLVTLACTTSLQPILASKLTEVTYVLLPEESPGVPRSDAIPLIQSQLLDVQALLVGCGLGQEPNTRKLVHKLLVEGDTRRVPLLVDADGLNALAEYPKWWEGLSDASVLTPHPGEMARLLGVSSREVQSDRIGIAREAAHRWGKVVLLKGAYTVVAKPDGCAMLSPFANPGLASAGTGDVLAGVIAGLMAQGLEPWYAACCGVYLHGLAGERVREQMGNAGMLASDLLSILPKAIKELVEG